MCRSRGAHVACTRTYSGQGARKKIRPHMCTYGRGLEPLLAHTYGEGSCTWLGQNGETSSSSCSWGGNGMRHVHREATECVVSIGRAWTEQAMETRPRVPQNGGNDLVFDRPRSKRDPVHREGCGVPQNGGNGPPTVETGVLLIGRGVAYRKTEETDLCWSATIETGVMFIGRGVAYRKTGLRGILFISTVDPLQPPRATVHPPSTSSSLYVLLFIQPPPRATPPAIVQPPLHCLL